MKCYINSKLLAQFNHLVWSHAGDLLVFLVEVLCELSVLDFRVVDGRQRIYDLQSNNYYNCYNYNYNTYNNYNYYTEWLTTTTLPLYYYYTTFC